MLATFFRDGGFPMYCTLVFGFLFIATTVLYALRPERSRVPLMVGLGLLTACSGLLGFSLGVELTLRALHTAPRADQFVILQLGVAESNNDLLLMLMLIGVGALAISAGAYQARRAGDSRAMTGQA